MPLQNRVTPFGAIVAMPERGTMMGNRGGRIHDEHRSLGARRWTSRRWICCELTFKGWWRPVMGRGYTELFFLDEVTALAAGHRPCFECRRSEAKTFAAAFSAGQGASSLLGADAMDERLHRDRLQGKDQRRHMAETATLPQGAMIVVDGAALARHSRGWLRWSPSGWQERAAILPERVSVLTPESIVAALREGYLPRWHGTAGHLRQ